MPNDVIVTTSPPAVASSTLSTLTSPQPQLNDLQEDEKKFDPSMNFRPFVNYFDK